MQTPPPKVRWVRPQQARSQETLDRLCEAAEALLEKKLFEQITVEEVAAEAGSSVGGFYARLPDKEALFDCLCARYLDELQATIEEAFSPARWGGVTLRPRVAALAEMTVEVCRTRRGLLRTLALRVRTGQRVQPAEERVRRAQALGTLRGLLLACAGEMSHPDPESATHLGLFAMFSTIHEKILFSQTPHASAVEIADEGLTREMTRMFLAYVGACEKELTDARGS